MNELPRSSNLAVVPEKENRRLLLIGPRMGETPTGVSQAFEDFISYAEQHPSISAKTVDMSLESCIRKTGGFNLTKAIYVLKRLAKIAGLLIRSDQAYLVISSSLLGFLKDCCIIWMCFFARKPITLHLNGGGYTSFYRGRSRLGKALIRFTLNRAESVIVLGELLKEQFDFVRPDKIQVVPNGVDMTPPTTEAKKSPANGDTWEFLYLSNLMETKGYLETAEAFLELLESGKTGVRIHFCGNFLYSSIEGSKEQSDRSRERFQEILQMPIAQGNIIYHGNADSDLKQEMLAKCHSLILPTTYPGEGQPLCILEAMAFGLPVLATPHAAVPEQVLDGRTGYLLKSRSANAILKGVMKLISPFESDYSKMSRASREKFLSHFTVETYRVGLASVLGLPEQSQMVRKKKAA